MEGDYKEKWDRLRTILIEKKKKHAERKGEFAMLGSMLAEMLVKGYDVVLAEMERLETGVVHCVSCGAELVGGEGCVCEECVARSKRVKDDLGLDELLFSGDKDSNS